jgi:hypothetical protein
MYPAPAPTIRWARVALQVNNQQSEMLKKGTHAQFQGRQLRTSQAKAKQRKKKPKGMHDVKKCQQQATSQDRQGLKAPYENHESQ